MNMINEEKEQLRQQAIEANEKRVAHLKIFLDAFPLDTDVNKTVALELATAIAFIKKDTDKLKNLVIT